MFNRYGKIAAVALLMALAAGFLTNPGSWDYFRFKLGNYDIEGERVSIKNSIKLFSSTMAGFYASGGNPAGLNIFPAENLIKRRIFIDINADKKDGLVLVIDRDKSEARQILFADPTHAVAVIDENWFSQYQDYSTRRPISDKKANFITVRYFLKKMWSKWIVFEYEVYGRDDRIPPIDIARVVRW